ncbi:listeriolysin S family TOMM bacteriocin [Carnobacterium maltaromaticum]|uniref:listeriolysin S family TOMM bacteriocin n=1 Tax=Carnobacterium TaxID=2747 RepID=UPI0039AEB43B
MKKKGGNDMDIKSQSVNSYSNNSIGSTAMNYAAGCCSCSCSTCTCTCASTATEVIK